jgi:hypothetical protein
LEKPNCCLCESFLITWDTRQMYACPRHGLRVSRIPSAVVLETTGQECTQFRRKIGKRDA